MSDVYRPPVADAVPDAAPTLRTPWRALGICMGAAWFVIVARIAARMSGWELSPYLVGALEWMPLAMVIVFVVVLRKLRAAASPSAWLALVVAEATVLLPVLFLAWATPILVTEAPSPRGLGLARTYASCWFVCDAHLYVGSRLSPFEEHVEARSGSVPADLVWSADGGSVSFGGPEIKNDVEERACRPGRFFVKPLSFLMLCGSGRR